MARGEAFLTGVSSDERSYRAAHRRGNLACRVADALESPAHRVELLHRAELRCSEANRLKEIQMRLGKARIHRDAALENALRRGRSLDRTAVSASPSISGTSSARRRIDGNWPIGGSADSPTTCRQIVAAKSAICSSETRRFTADTCPPFLGPVAPRSLDHAARTAESHRSHSPSVASISRASTASPERTARPLARVSVAHTFARGGKSWSSARAPCWVEIGIGCVSPNTRAPRVEPSTGPVTMTGGPVGFCHTIVTFVHR